MNYDPYCVEEKIISDMNEVFKKDPQLKEFDIILETEARNQSPIIHVQHNMGIEIWCVKTLFMYCYENCLKLESVWRKEHVRWEKYSRTALLLNPYIATFWNYRKRLISSKYLDPEKDFFLTRIILSHKPKSLEALNHRRWLLMNYSKSCDWVEDELRLCTDLADKAKCNYHVWSHRQWVFTKSDKTGTFIPTLWLSEFQNSEEWTRFHLSDHSGWHYRKFLLQQLHKNLTQVEKQPEILLKLINETKIKTTSQLYVSLLNKELHMNEELIMTFSGHETLWYYRRFLIQSIESFIPWIEEPFLDRCSRSSNDDPNQLRALENHKRWLSGPS